MQFDGEGSYVLVPYQKSVHMQCFSIWTRLNNILRAQPTPRTLDDWVRAIDNVGRLVRQVKKGNYATSYGCLWLARAFLLAEMCAAKHSCLRTVGINNTRKVARELKRSAAQRDLDDRWFAEIWHHVMKRCIPVFRVRGKSPVFVWRFPLGGRMRYIKVFNGEMWGHC